MGNIIDPEQLAVHYSRLATYCHVCLSLRRGCEALLDSYTNIYPLRIRVRTTSMSSHVNELFTGQKMASPDIIGSVRLERQNAFLSQLLRHYTTLSIDRTNSGDHSYRSPASKPFESSPDSLTEHSAF